MKRGRNQRRKWGLRFGIIILLTLGFLMPAPAPVMALNTNLAIGCTILGLLATPMIAYGVYEKLPSRRGRSACSTVNFIQGATWGWHLLPARTSAIPGLPSIIWSVPPPHRGRPRFSAINLINSLTGGVKFGYFTHSIPYLGLEVESSVNNSYVNRRTLSVNRVIQGASQVAVPNDFWINWTTALHLVGRYGFLPDKEVPFGRLQPYVGIGPAFIVLYEEVDSAKNFGIDVMAGVRYMFTKNIGAFVEYKYNHQWDVEIESHAFYLPNGAVGRGTAHLDFDCHKVVTGVAYHW